MIKIIRQQESLESEKALRQLTGRYIVVLAEAISKKMAYFIQNKDVQYLRDNMDRKLTFFVSYRDVRFPAFLRDFERFLSDRSFVIELIVQDTNEYRDIRGVYRQKDIQLYLTERRAIERFIDITYTQRIRRIEEFLQEDSYIQSVLLHELTHAYDDFVSSGKYISSDYKNPWDSGYDTYAKQNVEVNARYAQAIRKLEVFGIRYYEDDFENVVSNFKDLIGAWGVLSDDQQKRLIARLYEWYTQPITGKREKQKALKYVYNQALLDQLRPSVIEFDNSRIQVPKHLTGIVQGDIDVEAYAKEKAEELINGTYDRKTFKSYRMLENPYMHFNMTPTVDTIEKLKGQKERSASKLSPLLSSIIDSKTEEIRTFIDKLSITDEEFEIMQSRFK